MSTTPRTDAIIFDADHDPYIIKSYMKAIDELKQVEAELEAANQDAERLAETVRHVLNREYGREFYPFGIDGQKKPQFSAAIEYLAAHETRIKKP